MNKLKIKKGDKVVILSGRDKGKTGIVERVFTKNRAVLVPKVNVVKKAVKVSKDNPAGGIIDSERPLPVSRVQLICSSCEKKTRIKLEKKGDKKQRVCTKCGKVIEARKEEKKEK
ncbi:MAG: 50S ribosomal protein L24 [Patescibacteria group bacterium]|nr:50S ribosomal protein L24 [Patescibacteria group bacterium]